MDTQKHVLWISRHTMTAAQRADLERALGGHVELLRWEETVEDVRALMPLIGRGGRGGGGAPAGQAG